MIEVRTSSAILAVLVLLVAGAGAAVKILKPEWLSAAPPSVVEQAPASNDPLAGLPDSVAALLVRPAPDAPSPLIRIARVRPKAFCDNLVGLGLTSAAFRANEPPQRGWSCVTDLVKPAGGEDASASSLFVSAQGLDQDRIDTIRMKLNLVDPSTAAKVQAFAREALAGICRSLGWEAPEQALDALDRPAEGRVLDRGVSYDLKREFGEPPRFNLIIAFPRLIGAGGEGRFVTDGRRGPVTR